MKIGQLYVKQLTAGLLIVVLVSCNNQTSQTSDKAEISTSVENREHDNIELANQDNREVYTISDFNTDNPKIQNINRPKKSTIKTNLDTALLFAVWTSDPDGPHADFELTSNSFNVVDYDGNGDMPYELNDDKLKVYYNDFIHEGKVISVDKDTLKIKWKNFDNINNYVKWTE